MALPLEIGYIDKQVNSTKQIFTQLIKHYDSVKLKQPTDMDCPVFILNDVPNPEASYVNYAYFNNRYYWVDRIVRRTRWHTEVHCHLDVLATYRNSILDNTCLVAYSDRANRSPYIDDLRFAPEYQRVASQSDIHHIGTRLGLTTAQGSEWMTVVFKVLDTRNGGLRTYATYLSEFLSAIASLQGSGLNAAIGAFRGQASFDQVLTEVGQDLCSLVGALGGTGSWRDNLVSAKLMWLDINNYCDDTHQPVYTPVFFGSVPVDMTVVPLGNLGYVYVHEETVPIPTWSTAYSEMPFLKLPRWTAWQVITPNGYTQIDSTTLVDISAIRVYLCLDKVSGEWSIRLEEAGGEEETIASFSGVIGMDIMESVGTDHNMLTSVMNTASTVAKVAMPFVGMASVAGAQTDLRIGQSINQSIGQDVVDTSALQEKVDIAKQQQQTTKNILSIGSGIHGAATSGSTGVGSASGSLGGWTGFGTLKSTPITLDDGQLYYFKEFLAINLICFFPYLIEGNLGYENYGHFCDKYGYPCNKWLKLVNIHGYCRTAGASLVIRGATVEEMSQINSLLNSGIYIE